MTFQPPKNELASQVGSLYRYRKITCDSTFDKCYEMIKKHSLWFWHVTGQNDENECKPILKYQGTLKEKYNYFISDFITAFPHIPKKVLKNWARKASKKPNTPKPSMVYDYWAICCFTTESNCPHLWKDYGGDGNGIVIEYDASENSSIGRAGKVKYSNNPIVLNLLDVTEEICYQIFTTKLLKWSFEKEYTMVLRLNEPRDGQNVIFKDVRINSVRFGSKLNQYYKDKLVELCNAKKINVIE